MFLLTSANEGAPGGADRSARSGVPVVATDAGGTASVVDAGETGLLAPVGAVEQLQQSVARLRRTRHFAPRWASWARRMRERFSLERMVDDTDRLYARILGR